VIEANLSDLRRICELIGEEAKEDGVHAVLHDPMSVILLEGDGGAFFVWRGPGIFETHCFFGQRGREVIDLSQRMLGYMRENHGARTFWAAVPWDRTKQSRKVRLFCRSLGWESRGRANLAHGLCELFIGE
jgi:hypothetical protein